MPTNCLLHNTRTCTKISAIQRARRDDRVRIVHAFDWGTKSKGIARIKKEVKSVFKELHNEFPRANISFTSLGARDGSIYCDICRQIRSSDIALFDISTYNLNVVFELGLAIGTGAYVFILRSTHFPPSSGVLSDLNGILEYRFSHPRGRLRFQADFKGSLKAKLRGITRRRLKTGDN